jgi:DNA replication and repair protein RecF
MITYLTLKNYRNITLLETRLSSINLIIGPNGIGKTNFLESIYYLFNGTSFKTIGLTWETIGSEEGFSLVETHIDSNTYTVITSNTPHKSRVFKKNNKKISLKDIQKAFKVIVFAPNSVDLVDGPPEVRRNDIDLFLSSFDLTYKNILARYEKILKNKNAVLKHIRESKANPDQLEFWNKELAKTAEILVTKRLEILPLLNEITLNTSKEILKKSEIKLQYSHFKTINISNYSKDLLEIFLQNKEKEIMVGKTLYGPHKDTINILLNQKDLRYFGSRGEQRIAAFCIKFAQLKILKQQEIPSIFLIDDIFSELDNFHKQKIGQYLISTSQYHQCIITSSTKEEIPETLIQKATTINLVN